jgi:hypothetical protein
MTNPQFRSSSFYFAQWASEERKLREPSRPDPKELDVVESTTSRQVCEGSQCSLFFDQIDETYQPLGACDRGTLCTEARILKDLYYVRTGSISATNGGINYESQLLNWEIKR